MSVVEPLVTISLEEYNSLIRLRDQAFEKMKAFADDPNDLKEWVDVVDEFSVFFRSYRGEMCNFRVTETITKI